MGDTPKVSVCLNVYNGAEHIRECIDSVLAQTFTDFEFVIVDDCSTDATLSIIQSYSDERIRVIRNDVRRHMVYAQNVALGSATGEWIAHIDHDDMWVPEKLEKQMEYLDNHPEVGVCFSYARIIGSEKKDEASSFLNLAFHTSIETREELIRYLFYKGNTFCHSSVVFKNVYKMKYNLLFRQLQDFDMWCRLACITEFHVIPEELVHYRWDSLSENGSALTEKNEIRSGNEYEIVKASFLQNMPDSLFKQCFSCDFVNKESETNIELSIEKAFLLCSCNGTQSNNSASFMQLFNSVLEYDQVVEILENKYGLSLIQLYEKTGDLAFYHQFLKKNLLDRQYYAEKCQILQEELIIERNKSDALEKQLSETNTSFDNLLNSTSWKATKPFRKIMSLLKRKNDK